MIDSEVIELVALKADDHSTCPKCGTIYHFQELNLCSRTGCPELIKQNYSQNYFRKIYTTDLTIAIPIEAEEHSGQISDDDRRKIEQRFKDSTEYLNVLVCTPTMELGIDIGELSAIYMRNVPPDPSRYAQRAGRAGRKNQPSIITTFCGVGSVRGPHDQYFYRFPNKIIAGRISPPRFSMDNKNLLRAHIHSIIIEKIDAKIHADAEILLNVDAIDPEASEGLFPIFHNMRSDLEAGIRGYSKNILESVKRVFHVEINSLSWFNNEWILSVINDFVEQLDRSFDFWRREYWNLLKEADTIHSKATRHGWFGDDRARHGAIMAKLKNMREGERDFYVFKYLAMQGFLPNYGFPSLNTYVSFFDRDDELSRDQTIALSEYAPGNTIYLRGNQYQIVFARPKKEVKELLREPILICPSCQTALFGNTAITAAACPNCSFSFEEIYPHENCTPLPDMYALRRERITSDEEERTRLGSNISPHYERGEKPLKYVVRSGAEHKPIRMTYDHDANIILINKGTRQSEEGFTLCTACNRWLFGKKGVVKHLEPDGYSRCRKKDTTEEEIIHGIYLYTRTRNDVILFEIELPEYVDSDKSEYFYQTFKETVIKALQVYLDLSNDELNAFLLPHPTNDGEFIIELYETAEGGVGILQRLSDINRFRGMIEIALEFLHESKPAEACQVACYDCLLTFQNQRIHHLLEKQLVIPLLKSLRTATISEKTEETPTKDIDLLLNKCETELERQVLRKIVKLSKRIPDEAQKRIYVGDRPIVRVDFFYKPDCLLFVDGPDHDKDYVKIDDQRKRDELRGLGYRIFVVRTPEDVTLSHPPC